MFVVSGGGACVKVGLGDVTNCRAWSRNVLMLHSLQQFGDNFAHGILNGSKLKARKV